MNIFALLSLIAALISFFLGAYVYSKSPLNRLHRIFLFLCLIEALYAYSEYELRSSVTADEAFLWLKAGILLWALPLAIFLHFSLIFSNQFPDKRKYIFLLVIYSPAFLLSIVDLFTHSITGDLVKKYWGWSYERPYNIISIFSQIWALLVTIISIYMIFIHYLNGRLEDRQQYNQRKYVLIGFTLTVAIGIFADVISPAIGLEIPELAVSSFIVGNIFISFAIVKYQLFTLTPEKATHEIVSTMQDCLILIKTDGIITEINSRTIQVLGYSRMELMGKAITILFKKDQQIELSRIHNDIEMVFQTKTKKFIPVSVSTSFVEDKYHRTIGVVLIARDITERKRIENELKEAEKRLSQVAYNTGAWIWEIDEEGRYTYSSPVVEKVLGYQPKEIIGRFFYDFYHPTAEANAKYALLAILSLKESFNGFIAEHKDQEGKMIIVETNGFPLFDDNNRLIGFRGSSRDISEQVKWEEKIRESENRFKLLFNHVFEAVIIFNKKGKIIGANKAISKLIGYSVEKIHSLNIYDIHLDRESIRIKEALDSIGLIKKIYIGEIALIAKNKSEIITEAGWVSFEADHQNLIVASYRDITERLKSEEQLRLTASVFEHTLEGIVVFNPEGIIQSVNPAFCLMSGYQQQELINKSITIINTDKQNEGFYKNIGKILQKYGQWKGELWQQNKRGEVIPQLVSINSIYDKRGQIDKYIAVTNDITEIKQKEEIIKFQAYHDSLTNLPNRTLFYERLNLELAHAKRDGKMLAVIFLDLDQFKLINDNYGHETGDSLLLEVSVRLTGCIRESDTVARMGGDEFTFIIPNISSKEDPSYIASRILNAFSSPFVIKQNLLSITPSMGISIYPLNGKDTTTLIQKADTAMYKTKTMGKNNFTYYSDSVNSA